MWYSANVTGVAFGYTDLVPRRPAPEPEPLPEDLKRVADAAQEVGLAEQTIWRYLARSLLTRYKTKGIRRPRTMVDMKELRERLENPPAERVDRSERPSR